MEKLGHEREKLYKQERLKLSNENIVIESRRQQLSGMRHILPFDMIITGTGRRMASCRRVHLPNQLNDYVKSIVIPDRGMPPTALYDQDDKLDWHPKQFSLALESYLVFSKDKTEIDGKILKLWELYGPSSAHGDLRAVILRSDIIQSWLWNREALNEHVRAWLPAFPALDGSQNVDFDPLPSMPPRIDISDGNDVRTNLVLALREPEEDDESVLKTFLAPFKRKGFSISGASTMTTHKLTVLVVAWILTMLKVPRTVITEAGDGPIDYAIQKVRLSQEFLDIYNSSVVGGYTELQRSMLPCRLLHLVLPFVSLREVDNLVHAVFSAAKTPISEAVSMSVLRSVGRLGIPHLASEQAFHVLEDVEASSWHRQIITTGTVNHCRPMVARDLMNRLLTYTQERRRQQVESRRTEPKLSVGTDEPPSPSLKISTHKMVMQLLATVVQLGSIDAPFVERSAGAGLLEVPAAIRSYVVDVLAGIVQDSFVIGREGDKQAGKWEVLSPFISAAQRLNEDVPFSDEQWAAARAGEIPMPEITDECHIANSLLSRDTLSMPSSLKRAWAEKVVEPIITGHVRTRTMWMKTAVAREGGSKDLEASIKATYGSGIPASSSFTIFAPHLPQSHKSLLQILEHDALRFLSRSRCQELRDLMDKNHPVGWELESYGKQLTQLTTYAISDVIGGEWQTMNAIAEILFRPNIPSFLIEDVTESLKRIGLTLLQPEHMAIYANHTAVVPFASFTRFVTTHLAPPSKDSLDPKVVSLLAEYLSRSEALEHQKSEESLNGGACYWRVNLMLKVGINCRSVKVVYAKFISGNSATVLPRCTKHTYW
jgi:hypothetical protein